MFDKLELVENRYEELTQMISDPEVIANQSEWQKLMKEHASIEEVVFKYREYKKVKQNMEEAKEMMQDPEMKELAETEFYEAKEMIPKIEEELKILLFLRTQTMTKTLYVKFVQEQRRRSSIICRNII